MKQRVISAIIALIIVIPLIILGGYAFYIGLSIIGIIGFYEMIRCRGKYKKVPNIINAFAMICFVLLMLSTLINFSTEKLFIICVIMMLVPLIFITDRNKYCVEDAFYYIGVILFLGLAFNYIINMRDLSLNYFIYVILITISTDTFAHFYGTKIGKNKLCPKVSPNKTIEGMFGGTFLGTYIGTMFLLMVSDSFSIIMAIIVSLALSLCAQAGDLVFSAIKRKYGVKDYGNIMPGHGGVLDRLDSIIFAMYAFTFILYFV